VALGFRRPVRRALIRRRITPHVGGIAAPEAASDLAAQCFAASAVGLRHALLVVGVLFVWAAVHYLLAARHIRQDRYVAG
jgi:hypothetical protein